MNKLQDDLDIIDWDLVSQNPYSESMKEWLINKGEEYNDTES